jgi:hypothetical protein
MFKASDIVRSVGVPATQLSQWLDRGIIKLGEGDLDSNTSGVARQFGRARMYQIALAYDLCGMGVNATVAARAAAVFVDQGQPGRNAGELFASGKTILLHTATGTRIANSHDGDGFGVALHVIYGDVSNVVVDCGALVARVDAGLSGSRARKTKARGAA